MMQHMSNAFFRFVSDTLDDNEGSNVPEATVLCVYLIACILYTWLPFLRRIKKVASTN